MNWTCICGAQWRQHLLSAPRQVCPECDSSICAKCDLVRCQQCKAALHEACAYRIVEDYYCWNCYTAVMREALKNAPLDERLAKSLVWAEEKKDKGAVHPLFGEIMGAHFGKGWNG